MKLLRLVSWMHLGMGTPKGGEDGGWVSPIGSRIEFLKNPLNFFWDTLLYIGVYPCHTKE